MSLLPRLDSNVRVSLQHTPSGAASLPSVPPSSLGSPLSGDIRLVPGVPLFPTLPPGRGPFASLTPREPSSLGLVALSPVAARLGVLTADRRYGKAREASRSCGAPGLTHTWSCPLVAELLESLSTQPWLPGTGILRVQLPMLPIPWSGLFSGGAWLKVMSGCLPRLWAEPRSLSVTCHTR